MEICCTLVKLSPLDSTITSLLCGFDITTSPTSGVIVYNLTRVIKSQRLGIKGKKGG